MSYVRRGVTSILVVTVEPQRAAHVWGVYISTHIVAHHLRQASAS